MKKRTLFKKAALTVAVSLALAQSVWAMPTGGTVESGNVLGFAANPDSGATFTADGNSIINWDAFGIAAGEILNFNTANGALLNRVTGNLRSDIFGTLTQTGAHPMFLVNPNGILVGNGATINANSLVLSTLAISNDDFMNGATGHSYTFTKPTGKTIAEPLQFHGKNTTVTIGETLKALGGTVEVADGVTFVANSAADINLVAAETVGGKLASTSALSMTGTKDNIVSVADSTLGTQGRVYMQGGELDVTNSTVTGKEVYLRAAESYVPGKSQDSKNATVAIKNSAIKATKDDNGIQDGIGRSFIVGGNVTITESNIHGIENVRAFEGWDYGENAYPTYTTGAGHEVAVKGSTLDSARRVRLQGGTVSVSENSKLEAPLVQLWAQNKYVNAEDIGADETNAAAQNLAPLSAENTVAVSGSTLSSNGNIHLLGGSVAVSNQSLIQGRGGLAASAGELSVRDSNVRARSSNFQSSHVTLDNADIQLDDNINISDVYDVDPRQETPRENVISLNKTNLRVLGREAGGSGNVVFTGKTFEAKDSTISTSGTAGIYADSAIALNNTNLNADYGMYLTGGKVDITKSSLTSPVDNFRNGNLVIKAEETNVSKPYSTNKMGGHSVTLTDTTVESGQDIVIEAGKVALNGSTLKSGEETTILAADSMTGSMSTTRTVTMGTDSTVEITGGSNISVNEKLVIGGREVSVTEGSTVSAGTQLSVGAGTAGTIQDYVITMTGTPGKISVSTDSKLLQNGADVTDTIATNRVGPTPTPTPTPNPDPAPTPEIPTAKTLAENVENGKTAMSTVLANNATVETRKNGVKMLIESINQSTASGAVKSAKISGVFLAILDDKSLTDAEKVSLQREIVQTFHPTQIANAEANQTIDNASQAGASAAAGDTQPKNTERTFPKEEMPIVKGL